ncbi:MAG: ATP-binding protein [Anaerolineaceae bacterium]
MKKSLRTKLIVSYLAVAIFTILAVSLVIRLTSDRSIRQMVIDRQVETISTALESYYKQEGNLQGFQTYYFSFLIFNQAQRPQNWSGQTYDMRGLSGLVDSNGRVLFPFSGYRLGETVPTKLYRAGEPVKVDNKTIAWIILDDKAFTLNPEEVLFQQRINLAIGLGMAAGLVLAIVAGILLSGEVLKPIRRLTEASSSMAGGNIGQQVPVSSSDEIGQLTVSFNTMSEELSRVDNQRKQMTADITHDLSTPIQIISGYIELLENGEMELDQNHVDIIRTELEHLHRLVGDLTTLSQVEVDGIELRKDIFDANILLEQAWKTYEPMAHKADITLKLSLDSQPALITADEGRMSQILKNLVENALRYTPGGGQVTLSSSVQQIVELSVCDTGQGIDAADIPCIFDRFYQVDKARTGSRGKMGLGLAICQALAEAQGIHLRAESEGLGKGSCFILSIPKAEID